MKERDPYIDFLRFVGLSLIILAHVNPPYVIGQLRSFDVPLMLFVSGLSISGKKIDGYWKYLWERTKRLVLPVWIFLAVYLSIFYFSQSLVLPEQYLTPRMILRSFLFLDESIGYVWIIRIFLLVMIVTPLLKKIEGKIANDWYFIVLLTALYLCTGALYIASEAIDDKILNFIIRDILQYAVAYSIPFIIGVRIKTLSENNKESKFSSILIVLCLAGVVYSFANNGLDISHSYKFPPRSCFILYGVLMCVVAWISRGLWNKKIVEFGLFGWIGRNTIWIYLWHMPLVLCANYLIANWLIKYLLVYSTSAIAFFVQYSIVKRSNNSFAMRYFVG